MNNVSPQTWQWQPALNLQGNHKILAILHVQLEETEEQIETLEHSRIDLLEKITSIQQQILLEDLQQEYPSSKPLLKPLKTDYALSLG